MFAPTSLVIIVGISAWVAWDRAAAGWPSAPRWEIADSKYQAVTDALLLLDPSPGTVAVNDPPGFYLASGLPCVVVPYGDSSTLRSVVDRFNIEWVILDANFPAPLEGVYQNPESVTWIAVRGELDDVQGRPVYLLQVAAQDGDGTP